jgi:hypothetical protein
MVLLCLAAAGGSVQAAVMGAAPARPYAEAVAVSRTAAKAVLARQGRQSCLIGKLTNALLSLSSSCEAAAQRGALCRLADQAAATTRWSMDFTDATARSVLELSGSGSAGSPAAAKLQSATP